MGLANPHKRFIVSATPPVPTTRKRAVDVAQRLAALHRPKTAEFDKNRPSASGLSLKQTKDGDRKRRKKEEERKKGEEREKKAAKP